MRTSYLEAEDLAAITKFVTDGDDSVLKTDAVDRFLNLHSALEKKMLEHLRKSDKENLKLQCSNARFRERDRRMKMQGTFDDSQLDSADIAKALKWCLQNKGVFRLSKNKVILILYGMYATWLAEKQERLFIEHPVASEWGPQLWRAYKNIDTFSHEPEESFKSLEERNKAVAVFCRNAAKKYGEYREEDLKKLYINSFPYQNAMPRFNKGKWNMEISDSDIYAWKTEKEQPQFRTETGK